MCQYKLMYFDGRGLGELIRYIFLVADVPFEDFRWEWMGTEWPIYKPKTPFGQCPVLEIKESEETHYISQSNTIARFLANRFGLAGETDIEQAKTSMIIDQLNDLYHYYEKAYYQDDEVCQQRDVKTFRQTKLPQYYESIEKYISRNQPSSELTYSVGSKLTYADLAIACSIDRDQLNELIKLTDTELEAFPRIKRIFESINNHPKITESRKNRKDSWY